MEISWKEEQNKYDCDSLFIGNLGKLWLNIDIQAIKPIQI